MDTEREARIARIADLIRSDEAIEIEKSQRSMLDFGSMEEWAEARERTKGTDEFEPVQSATGDGILVDPGEPSDGRDLRGGLLP